VCLDRLDSRLAAPQRDRTADAAQCTNAESPRPRPKGSVEAQKRTLARAIYRDHNLMDGSATTHSSWHSTTLPLS